MPNQKSKAQIHPSVTAQSTEEEFDDNMGGVHLTLASTARPHIDDGDVVKHVDAARQTGQHQSLERQPMHRSHRSENSLIPISNEPILPIWQALETSTEKQSSASHIMSPDDLPLVYVRPENLQAKNRFGRRAKRTALDT